MLVQPADTILRGQPRNVISEDNLRRQSLKAISELEAQLLCKRSLQMLEEGSHCQANRGPHRVPQRACEEGRRDL